jgi:hypothetical protein
MVTIDMKMAGNGQFCFALRLRKLLVGLVVR